MSIFGDIAKVAGETITPLMAEQMKGMSDGQLQAVMSHLTEVMQANGGTLGPDQTQGLHDLIEQFHASAPEQPADALPIPHEIDIQAVQADLPHGAVLEVQPDMQAQMDAAGKVMDQAREILDSRHDAIINVIQNLHADAGDHSGVEVAVADSHGADAHAVAADGSSHSESSHQQEAAAPSHDDGSASA